MINIKWYWPMELLGLVEDVSEKYNDGTTYIVSSKCGDVFMWMLVGFVLFCVVCGMIMTAIKKDLKAVKIFSTILILYAVFLAVGIGPYIQLYPQGAGFIDFSAIEHIIDGVYMLFCALMAYLGGKIVLKSKRIVDKGKTGSENAV